MTLKKRMCRQWSVVAFAEEPRNTDENADLKFDEIQETWNAKLNTRLSQLY